MTNMSQLLLTVDHLKLSLLERQRAISLNLEPNAAQESNIARSLESLREGIESLAGTDKDGDDISRLRSQYQELSRQFHGESSSTTAATSSQKNNASLEQSIVSGLEGWQNTRQGQAQAQQPSSVRGGKNVRFRDDPASEDVDEQDEANRTSLFRHQRYTDDDNDEQGAGSSADPTADMSNQQIHAYHEQVMREQDDHLDSLTESIGRQRHLAMQVGDELEGQIALLDHVDHSTDRFQTRLDGARRRLQGVGESAKANWGMTTIIILIVILVFLIVVLK